MFGLRTLVLINTCQNIFEWFTSYKPLTSQQSWPFISVAGHKTDVANTGTMFFLLQLPDQTQFISLDGVLYVCGLDCNIFFTIAIAKKHGFIFIGGVNRCTSPSIMSCISHAYLETTCPCWNLLFFYHKLLLLMPTVSATISRP